MRGVGSGRYSVFPGAGTLVYGGGASEPLLEYEEASASFSLERKAIMSV